LFDSRSAFVIEVEVGISSCAKFHHGASDFLRIGAVGFDNNRRNAQRQCRLRSFSRSIRRFAIGQGDRRTVRGELLHDRGSDAPGAAEHKRGLIRKPHKLFNAALTPVPVKTCSLVLVVGNEAPNFIPSRMNI
jgi:hypothetical protein